MPLVDGYVIHLTISIHLSHKLGKLAADVLCSDSPESQPFCLQLCAYLVRWKHKNIYVKLWMEEDKMTIHIRKFECNVDAQNVKHLCV